MSFVLNSSMSILAAIAIFISRPSAASIISSNFKVIKVLSISIKILLQFKVLGYKITITQHAHKIVCRLSRFSIYNGPLS